MKRLILRLGSGKEGGFTVIEMMVSVLLTGIVSLGASMATTQVLNQTSHNADYVTAGRQAVNAISWINRDAEMAQVVSGAGAFPTGSLSFTWTTWENDIDRVTYSLSAGQLKRSWIINGGPATETVVAEYINADPALTSCTVTGAVLTVKITASVGLGSRVANVTLTHDTSSRPRL